MLFQRTPKMAFVASRSEEARRAKQELTERYKGVAPEEAQVIVALGGDGFMLETLHRFMFSGAKVYGVNFGHVGFMMNSYDPDKLVERIKNADQVDLRPLRMRAMNSNGEEQEALAINEVSLLRQTHQAAKIKITIDGVERLDEMVGDGILVATPAGSTAYNLSAHGPILPIGSNILALTPISAFRPRRWRGAVLSDHSEICFTILNPTKRPVSAVADFTEVRRVERVIIRQDNNITIPLLFDKDHGLEERIFREQFLP